MYIHVYMHHMCMCMFMYVYVCVSVCVCVCVCVSTCWQLDQLLLSYLMFHSLFCSSSPLAKVKGHAMGVTFGNGLP